MISKRSFAAAVLIAAFVLAGHEARAADERLMSSVIAPEITAPKKTLAGLYLHAEEARRFLETYSDIVLIDVRPSQYVKMSSLAIAHAHLPILLPVRRPETSNSEGGSRPRVDADGVPLPGMHLNPGFVTQVREMLAARGKDPATGTVFLFCGRGMFSARAADLLTESGFANVYAIIDSFES